MDFELEVYKFDEAKYARACKARGFTLWTKDEDNFLKTNSTMSTSNLAARLGGRSKSAIRSRCNKLGIFRQKRYSLAEVDFIRKNHSRLSTKEIAKKLGRSHDAIYRKIRSMGFYKGFLNGDRHPQSKLTDDDVELIRQLKESGLSCKIIADKFDVSRSQIERICAYSARAYITVH